MADHHDDDLAATKTEGFKVGEKKTLEEYQKLGKRWLSPICCSVWRDVIAEYYVLGGICSFSRAGLLAELRDQLHQAVVMFHVLYFGNTPNFPD